MPNFVSVATSIAELAHGEKSHTQSINKLENVAIAGHCNLRPPGLPFDPPAHPSGKLSCPKSALGPV